MHHRRACVKAKHLHEGIMGVQCMESNLDHAALLAKYVFQGKYLEVAWNV
jgi:hypothetical protein